MSNNSLLVFGHSQCARCVELKKELEVEGIEFQYVNVWDNQDLANKYGVRSFPSVILNKILLVNPSIQQIKEMVKQ